MRKNMLAALAVALGVAFVALALYYWTTPAGALPAYLPGFEYQSTHMHYKHGLASLLLGLASFAYAWFSTGRR